ncbi:MAG: 4-hydroxy-3-methylbut-2-enyl diphosphate reductase [Acholeplasmatales bacterium]|nr:4-hydroxy-3-methylbut-2-enyl diphosphate reductase [Acholeplasmatales bacterium]
MKIIKLSPQGYCGGVKRALKLIIDANNDPNVKKPIYMLGNIIHNKNVIKKLNEMGIKSVDGKKTRLELLEEINEGTIVISAHGVSPSVFIRAKEKGLNIIDASCPNVYTVHHNIKKYLKKNYDIIYIGTKGHPEAEGVLGISDKIHLISNKNDLLSLSLSNNIYVSNQTTLSVYDIKELFEAINKKYPDAIIDDKICNATTLRQRAVMEQKADLCIVVGDKSSSNSLKLQSVCQNNAHIKSYLVENEADLDPSWFKDVNVVSVTSGASTPDEVTEKVIKKIKMIS